MTNYKGYYIDHVCFNSKEDIDNFLKEQAVERFIKLNKYFSDHSTMEASILCSDQSLVLHNTFGFSWEEIEAMELAAIA